MNLMRTKTIEQSIRDTEEPEHQLRKQLGPVQLTVFGIGVIIGTGIFVLTGAAAGVRAGPAVALSFVFAGIVCALAALCYAEFASTVPVAGSAYTFSYASLGELIAWIIGWDLILELALGASTVAVGWSTYFADVMNEFGITIPGWAYGEGHNFLAAGIVLILTAVICLGIKVSSQVNFVMVVIKVGIVLFVIIAGLFYIKTANYTPFIPPAGSPGAPALSQRRRCCKTSASLLERSVSAASSPERPWCSSPTSASTLWRPRLRRRRTHNATCRSASSAPWAFAPRCTSRCLWSWWAW